MSSSLAEVTGFRGVCVLTDDEAVGMVGSIAGVFSDATCQRFIACFYCNVPAKVLKSDRAKVAAMLVTARLKYVIEGE